MLTHFSKYKIRSLGRNILMLVAVLALALPGHASDAFGNGIIKMPTSATGGAGTVANLQTDNDVNYTVANGNTMTVGGFGTQTGTINSVYLFVQYTVETGYTGTNAIQVNGVNTTIIPADRDYGRWGYIEITGGAFGINTSTKISTLSVTFNNDSGTSNAALFDCMYVVVNPQTPIPAPPTWSEDFNGTGQANPMVWNYEVGYKRNNELQYYVPGTDNGWMENGNFIIEGRAEASPNDPTKGIMDYTSASIVTSNKFYWKYGRAQIRAKIPAKPGMWPAIWGTGEVGNWPHNGEVDILEYYGEKILANCAVGNATAWSAKWFSSSKTVPSFEAVDSNWRNSYHIWTMQWDEQNVRLYVDNVLLKTVSQTSLKNTDGYNTAWGPQYPFISNGMSCWLNLAMGGAGGSPAATMSSGPQRYLIDYWKIWEGATSNVAPTDIVLSSNTVNEGLPAGTVVGTLSAADADPAEVHRYTLVSGTGSTHNSQFIIPEFVSDSTTQGVIKTATALNYLDGPTRSIRVRVTDIEGLYYEKVLTINVFSQLDIEVNPNSVAVAEGGTQTFDVRLRTLPASNITVNVSRQSGDSDITVSSGSSLLFTPANGTSWQTVTLAAAEDADKTNGVATILCSDASSTYSSANVTVTESDNDNNAPLVNAGLDDHVYLTDVIPWTPAKSSLAAWYDASDTTTITASSGTVTQWRDKSDQANHLNAVNDPKTGTRTINSKNAIDFSSDYLGMSSDIDLVGKSAFLALQTDALSDNQILIGNQAVNVQLRLLPTTGLLQYTASNNYYSNPSSSAGISSAQPATIGYLLNGNMEFSVNGAFADSGLAGGSGSTVFNKIGSGDGTRKPFDGLIGEVIISSGIPNTADRQKLEGYLAHKWGSSVRLPGVHPFKSAAPTLTSIVANLDGTVSDPDGNPLTTTWSLVSGPETVTFGNTSAVDTTVSFTATGTYVLRLTADDGVDMNYDEVTIYVSDPNSYSIWSSATFSKPFTETGFTSDPDGDALSNLQEFAFGTDPTDGVTLPLIFTEGGALTRPGLPMIDMNGGSPRAVFTRRKDYVTAGLTYTVDFSADLTQWTTSAATPILLTSATDPSDYEVVCVPFPETVPVDIGGTEQQPKFFRVAVDN